MSRISSVLYAATEMVHPRPSELAKVESLANSLLAKTQKAASKHPETKGALLGGSFAKGTWLPGHVDIDIFVRIDPSVDDRTFEKVGLQVGASATAGFPRGKKYAQHPYTEAMVDGIKVNIVPCFAVEARHWKSAADRSPFHVELVKSLPEATKTQIKLLKRFMKGTGVYGAEIQMQGFSGYVAEVLVMKLGSLEGVLRWFADLKPHNEDRFFSLPDPVDEGRDLATAVSNQVIGRMVLASREFLSNPRRAFFLKMVGTAHQALTKSVVGVVFSHERLSEDTLWGELRKTTRHMVRHAEVGGFRIARSMAASNNADRSAILLIPEFQRLPELEQHVGPTIDRRRDVEAFLSSNSRRSKLVWVDDDARVRLLRPRRYRLLEDLLAEAVSGKAGRVGASRELARGMKRSAKVLEGAGLTRAASSSKWLEDGIREIVSDALGTRQP